MVTCWVVVGVGEGVDADGGGEADDGEAADGHAGDDANDGSCLVVGHSSSVNSLCSMLTSGMRCYLRIWRENSGLWANFLWGWLKGKKRWENA